jgi:hypothetical protein
MPPAPDIEGLFKPASVSTRELLSEDVGGFEVPAYQRPYRWQPANVRRLFEDMVNALNRLDKDPDAIAFIGATITVATASPQHPDLPPNPRQVIDGQQRLTTVLMATVALREQLGEVSAQLEADDDLQASEAETIEWLLDQITEARSDLFGCLYFKKRSGEPGYQHLPKIIREMIDVWSRKAATATYKSPIANLLFLYLRSVTDDKAFVLKAPDVLEVPEAFGASLDDHEILYRRFRQIRQMLKSLSAGSESDVDATIALQALLSQNSDALTGLFHPVGPTLLEDLRRLAGNELGATALRLLFFARFLLDHVALTQITAKDESYAFDLFDSLNTTGEPLTAFETFVRLVVEAEGGVAAYHASPSFTHIAITGKLLAEREASVQRDTLNLVTSFALADHGVKVPNTHNEQRKDLQQRYLASGLSLDERRAMTLQLADSALTYFYLWRDDILRLSPFDDKKRNLAPETAIALKFADAINHTILVAPLSRYFAAFRANPTKAQQDELERALRAMVAFSCLWRAAHGGTDGIDGVYRGLMQKGLEGVCGPLARTSSDNHQEQALPPVDQLALALRKSAGDQGTLSFTTRNEWIGLSSSRNFYDDQKDLGRFFLLLSGHHAAPRKNGLLRDGTKSDNTDFLKPERWTDERLKTVEHVAPQTRTSGPEDDWPDDVYADAGKRQQLGNLTLVPLSENIEISNRSWKAKRVIYRALTADTPESAEVVLDDAVNAGIDLKPDLRAKIVDRRRQLPLLQAIADYDQAWDAAFIDRRSRDLLGRVWDILDGWLS